MACIDKVSKVVADSLCMCIYACIHRQAHAIYRYVTKCI